MVFIMWTITLFGMLWSAYLWAVSRQPQLSSASPRPSNTPSGNLDLVNTINGATLCPAPSTYGAKNSTEPYKAPKTGGGVSPSPLRESLLSLALLAAALGFLPAWKGLSGAASLPTLLGPAALAVAAMTVGLTVQMIRLPVLWCDRLKFLALVHKRGTDNFSFSRGGGRVD